MVTSQVSPGVVHIQVTLTDGATFHDSASSEHHALTFDLAGAPTITISGLAAPFTANGIQAPGSVSAAGFGDFQYVIDFPHETHPPVVTSFGFDVSATGLMLSSFVSNTHAFFTSDVWAGPGQSGNTGNVAAVSVATPEPASWALMLAGSAAMGGALRSRRRKLAQTS